ncbi:MAG: putative LPS assembly protein LptD [Verrucomicrobia bacterium]|nr:putative LPS assembly protein LptD [Verrucomicrobiota bacterium]
MTQLRAIVVLVLWALAFPGALCAQQRLDLELEALTDQSWVEYDYSTGLGTGTNGVLIRYGDTVLTADRVSVNRALEQVTAEGAVRIQHGEQIWVGEHIRYNFKTRQMEAEQFRTGKSPVYAAGHGLHAEETVQARTHLTNRLYAATNAFITTDDVAQPAAKIRAHYIKIVPGDKIVARHAVLYVEGVPVFYFPYYTRKLNDRANGINLLPGYRSTFGPFLLTSYDFFLGDALDGNVHVDYRQKQGFAAGPNLNYHLGSWGDGHLKYYYLNDQDPSSGGGNPTIPHDRQRVDFSYLANPDTNITVRSRVRWQSDTNIVREFFEGEYFENPQPNTFVEASKFWQNFALDTYAEPRLNSFLDTIERLPEVKLTGQRQQLWDTPVYYESESSAGYYRHLFAETNSFASDSNYDAARVDSYQKLVLPQTFFGWLNVAPRVGGRYTYYSTATGPGADTDAVNRWVFDTGAEASAKASRLWQGAGSRFFEVDGLRHIIEPSINYAYVPAPNAYGTNVIPQFDYQMPSLRLLPITFPEYNSIDSIQGENVFRFGLNNKLQTKREGQIVNLLNWNVYSDWNLRPITNQTTFSDLYSDFMVRPRSWLSLESLTRFEIGEGLCRMSLTTVTLQPTSALSWTLGQFYVRPDLSGSPTSLGQGNNLFLSAIYYRLNENWGFRAAHRFSMVDGTMQSQDYSIYRDMRSWTAALTLRVLNNLNGQQDLAVAFTFSLKASPRYGRGTDTSRPTWLWGG